MEKLKLGFIGLGQRGEGWVVHHFPNRDDIEVVAMCDIDPKKIEKVENHTRCYMPTRLPEQLFYYRLLTLAM